MSVSQNQIKESIVRALQDILNTYDQSRTRSIASDACQQSSDLTERTVKTFSKSVKSFAELFVSNDIECFLDKVRNANKETWKIDAHNLAKAILDESKLAKIKCVQDNLNNIIDSCIQNANHPSSRLLNDSDIDISPLLQPKHVSEIADCISVEKPLDIRLNALRVLLKSHFSEVVNGEGWFLLQKKLVENLCDNNIEIFVTSLKVHAKLGTCSSSLAIKECSLNILDSLGRHYFLQHNESKVTSFQSMYFYRMVYLTRLLLDTFREATMNIARFGESKLDEMIDNFIQLMSIHIPSKHSRNKPCLSPLEVVSYLDPKAKWLNNLMHFTLTRKLVFFSLSKNITFLRISIEEIVQWVNEPVIPSKNSSRVLQGEINISVHKFSLFCHSLAVLSSICFFSISCTLFPLKISKQEDLTRVENLLEMLCALLNNSRFIDVINSKATEIFVNLIAVSLAKLLSTNYINASSILLLFLSPSDKKPLENSIKLKILDIISQKDTLNNSLLSTESMSRIKPSLFASFLKSKVNNPTNQPGGNIKQKRDIDRKSSMQISMESENKDLLPSEAILKYVVDNLKTSEVHEATKLIKISTQILRNVDRVAGISFSCLVQIIYLVSEIYMTFLDNLKNANFKFKDSNIYFHECCEQFLLQVATSSLGFYYLLKNDTVASLLLNKAQRPIIDWSDKVTLMFISKAASSEEGCRSIVIESNGLLKNDLDLLWSTIEEDCSGSEIPVDESSKSLFNKVAYLCTSLRGVKALLSDSHEGSDITLTDDCDIKPTNLCHLIQYFALNPVHCQNFIHHEIALTVLEILVSNVDSSLYLQYKFKYQDILLQLQSDNRIDDNSEVIVDECSILRQNIIDQTYLPERFRVQTVPTHTAPRPESTLSQSRSRARGNGDLARWLSETRLGLHDNNWLKHARKLYKTTCCDDMKGSTIIDLLEQVVKVMPENRAQIRWQHDLPEDSGPEPEEQLGIQLVVRYGIHLRLIQSSQQNSDNLKHLLQLVKATFDHNENDFKGFDWFVSLVYLVCSGSIEKSQAFLYFVSCLPTGPLLWSRTRDEHAFAQLGNALEIIISEEMPIICQVLHKEGLSWWNLCSTWISQCWWGTLEWSHICHWLTISILYQPDHLVYFCVAVLHANHDRLLRLSHQGTVYELIVNPVEKFNFAEAKSLIEKLHKKYHSSLHSLFT